MNDVVVPVSFLIEYRTTSVLKDYSSMREGEARVIIGDSDRK